MRRSSGERKEREDKGARGTLISSFSPVLCPRPLCYVHDARRGAFNPPFFVVFICVVAKEQEQGGFYFYYLSSICMSIPRGYCISLYSYSRRLQVGCRL